MKTEPNSLVRSTSLLLALAILVGAITYLSLLLTGRAITERYMESSAYTEKRAAKRIESFQAFISKNGISVQDSAQITQWCKKDTVVLMEIYRGELLLYSTAAPEHYYLYDKGEEATIYDWATYHQVSFADGDAQVLVYADDLSQWDRWLIAATAAIGLLVALGIFLSGCKHIVGQICLLNRQVQRMEAGDLDVEIPILGPHELGQLAHSLDLMRCALREQLQREKELFHAHQTMITQMSHDLRTPLTTLQIYTDILRYKKYDPSMLDHHLKLIDAKACQIKQLADNIFEYSLVSRQQEIQLEPPLPARQVFHDLLSEYIYQWSRHGFRLTFDLEWTESQVRIHSPYIKRIMDNISSNLIKYASMDAPVHIRVCSLQEHFCITVENRASPAAAGGDSTHIGLSNIEMMMEKMQGTSRVHQEQDRFSITLLFPIW